MSFGLQRTALGRPTRASGRMRLSSWHTPGSERQQAGQCRAAHASSHAMPQADLQLEPVRAASKQPVHCLRRCTCCWWLCRSSMHAPNTWTASAGSPTPLHPPLQSRSPVEHVVAVHNEHAPLLHRPHLLPAPHRWRCGVHMRPMSNNQGTGPRAREQHEQQPVTAAAS